jgi:hypothetical protein
MNNLIDLSVLKTRKESFLDKNGAIITKEEIISPYLEEIERLEDEIKYLCEVRNIKIINYQFANKNIKNN